MAKKKSSLLKRYALLVIWRSLNDEYIKQFGFTESFLDIVRKQKEIALLKVNKIVTGDRSLETLIDVCMVELETLKKMSGGGTFLETKAYIEKGMGFAINPMKTSVAEFYNYIKVLEKQYKSTKHGN